MKKFLYWAPRVLAIIFMVFLIPFSFDVFEKGLTWRAILGFLIHNIPVILLLILLLIAWKRPRLGGILFLIIGIVGFFLFHVDDWVVFAIIILPVLIIGGLFLLSGKHSRQEK